MRILTDSGEKETGKKFNNKTRISIGHQPLDGIEGSFESSNSC